MKYYSVNSIQDFRLKSANPSFYIKHVKNNYLSQLSKFEMHHPIIHDLHGDPKVTQVS
jgi:hypothetical protein